MRRHRAVPLLAVAAALALLGLQGSARAGEPTQPAARFVRQIDWVGRGVWLKGDTHTHTQFSDGSSSISEVVAKAVEFGCDFVAITDHADRELPSGSQEYIDAIRAARAEHPEVIVLAGLEWNVPPSGGNEHAVVLFPEGPAERMNLAAFKERFDDLGREEAPAGLADQGLEWLAALAAAEGVSPVVIYEHPSQTCQWANEVVGHLRRLREINALTVGFAGSPGHQGMVPVGAYRGRLQTINRWDPAVELGDAWDRLLQKGDNLWGALAVSDFHDADVRGLADYWPGQFSETWIYAPERTVAGVLRALQAGAFFGVHGQIARQVELLVTVADLPRHAVAGETIEVPAHTHARVELRFVMPSRDWTGGPNHVDDLELIGVTEDSALVIAQGPPQQDGAAISTTVSIPPRGLVVRARGRQRVDGGEYQFYTNPVRVQVPQPASAAASVASGKSPAELTPPTGEQAGTEAHVSVVPLPWLLGAAAWLSIFALLMALAHPQRSSVEHAKNLIVPAPRRGHFLALALGFMAIAIYGSLVPFNFQETSLDEVTHRFWQEMNRDLTVGSCTDWAVNFLLFVPIGFLLLAACAADRGAIAALMGAALTVLVSSCLSLAVEFGQSWLPSRVPSKNDVVAQLLGTITSLLIWFATGSSVTRWLRGFAGSQGPAQRIDWLLQAYFVGLCVYSLLPLDLTIRPAELAAKYRNGLVQLVPFATWQPTREGWYGVFSDALVFVPVGMLVVAGLPVSHRRFGPWLCRVVLGSIIVLLIELCQLFVYSRFTDATQWVTGSAGCAIGAWWYRRAQLRAASAASTSAERVVRRGRGKWAFIAVLYAAVLVAFFWAPFQVVDDPEIVADRWDHFINAPFSVLQAGNEFNAITQIVRKCLLFAPLGGMLAAAASPREQRLPPSRASLTILLAMSSALALGIEIGQIWLADSTPDVSDVLLDTLGAAVGMLLVVRASPGPETKDPMIAAPFRRQAPRIRG